MSARDVAKRAIFEELLAEGVAALLFDPRRPGVTVPAHLRGSVHVRLNYSYRYHVADFAITDDEVRASLTFGGRPALCVVPWSAVFAVADEGDEQHWIWFDDRPHELGPPSPLPGAIPPDAVFERSLARGQRVVTDAILVAERSAGGGAVSRHEGTHAPSGRSRARPSPLRVIAGAREPAAASRAVGGSAGAVGPAAVGTAPDAQIGGDTPRQGDVRADKDRANSGAEGPPAPPAGRPALRRIK